MVVDERTGLQYGSIVERNLVIDATQFSDRRMRLRIRNTSGDQAFDLREFKRRLEDADRQGGFLPVESGEYGVVLDINVMYSGQIREANVGQFGFLGAVAGGLAGFQESTLAGTGAAIAGATLGSIVGSYQTDDTYIVVGRVTVAIVDKARGVREKTIVFSSSLDKEEEESREFQGFRDQLDTGIAVYAGGRNVPQSRITAEVRERFARILSDII